MIMNFTKKTKIGNAKILKSILSKAKGLMFCSKVEQPLLFVFEREMYINLHMMFVFCPIDVILIGESMKVVELKENLKPFTLFNSIAKAKYVIEAEDGTIRRTKTEVGDIIKF